MLSSGWSIYIGSSIASSSGFWQWLLALSVAIGSSSGIVVGFNMASSIGVKGLFQCYGCRL